MAMTRCPARRRTAASPFASGARVMRRQAWIALLMGLIAVVALRNLWSSNDLWPSASKLSRPLPIVESRLAARRTAVDGTPAAARVLPPKI